MRVATLGEGDTGVPERSLAETWKRIELSNVDHWFAATDVRTRQRRMSDGRHLLLALTRISKHVALTNLPCPASRRDYVDDKHPGRRAQFDANIRALTEELALPYVDLDGTLEERSLYRDFHHVKRENRGLLTVLVADRLGPVLRQE